MNVVSQVYSIMGDVLRVDLYEQQVADRDIHINQRLIDFFYADRADETLISKVTAREDCGQGGEWWSRGGREDMGRGERGKGEGGEKGGAGEGGRERGAVLCWYQCFCFHNGCRCCHCSEPTTSAWRMPATGTSPPPAGAGLGGPPPSRGDGWSTRWGRAMSPSWSATRGGAEGQGWGCGGHTPPPTIP